MALLGQFLLQPVELGGPLIELLAGGGDQIPGGGQFSSPSREILFVLLVASDLIALLSLGPAKLLFERLQPAALLGAAGFQVADARPPLSQRLQQPAEPL